MPGVNMIDTVDREIFNDEFHEDYERTEPELLRFVNTNGIIQAGTVHFDIIDPTDEAEERARDGKIPKSQLGMSRVSTGIQEKFKSFKIDDFDLFKNNPNVRNQQVKKSIIACNKSIDRKIYNTLKSGQQMYNGGAAVVLNSFGTCLDLLDQLWSDEIPNDGTVTALISTRAEAQLLKIEEFKNANAYVDVKPVNEGAGTKKVRKWLNVNWVTWTGMDGMKTNAADCMLWHPTACGHMLDGMPVTNLFYNDEDDYHGNWARIRHGGVVCLQRGILRFRHDDTAPL
jgi:hypothetical protein